MKPISVAITEFALPCPRRGSIEVLSGFGKASLLGQEIHERIQSSRSSKFTHYEPEVPISHEFERGDYTFKVSGRMDGFFASKTGTPTIEEIKTAFSMHELRKRLDDPESDHPYVLQLRTYGYFHWLNTEEFAKLSFHLVSTRNFKTEDLDIQWDEETLQRYETWLKLRLNEMVEDAKRAEKRAEKRIKASQNLEFPFENPRPGQVELIETVEMAMNEKKRLLVQAPTGLGKTMGVLYPSLKEAMSRGQRVIYVTPKNSQHAVAEDAVERLETNIKSLTITAKSKICFKNEPFCDPRYCEYAEDHYTKVAEHKVLEQLSKKRKLSAKTFQKIAKEYEVCPFEIQLDAAQEAETIICDYNYVFAPRSAFGRIAMSDFAQTGKPNLVIDEVHNLPARSMDYYSPSLSTDVLSRMRENFEALPKRFQGKASLFLDDCLQVIRAFRETLPKENTGPQKIDPPHADFLEMDSQLRAFLTSYLESDVEILPKDPILRLCFYWSEFTEALEWLSTVKDGEFFASFHPLPSGGVIKITCCDASKMLKSCYDEYEQVVGFSATVKPFDYYSRLVGLEPQELKTAEFTSPFPKQRRKLLVIPQISSKYSERERNYPRISETIHKISALKPGNYFAFFPSFEFMERVFSIFKPPAGFEAIKQERYMPASAIEEVLEKLKFDDTPTIMFAVQGGVFSEGVDYPGDMIIGAFIVGPPLPNFDLEREEMRAYYERHYEAGFDYAYTFPAMAKAVQAAGRVIRSETDRGIIVLMDNRFTQTSYTKSMPDDWFKENVRELVSDRILTEVSEFWQKTETI